MRTGNRIAHVLVGLVLGALAACRDDGGTSTPPPPPPPADGAVGAEDGATPGDDAGEGDAGAPAGDAGGAGAEPVVVAAWNLHNFSTYGTRELRIDAIAAQIDALDADVVGVEEIKVEDGTEGVGPQAWDALLERLPTHDGVHNPYDTFDTAVGLIFRRATATIVDYQTILTSDRDAFPRPPLDVTVRVVRGTTDITFHVVVVHLKAFGDSVERRRSACAMLRAYIESHPDRDWIVIGDFNDDPYDPPAENSFVGTFLDAEPDFHFVTASLPPESITSLGYYHYVDGVQIRGELLDHAVVTGSLVSRFAEVVPSIVATDDLDAWEMTHSDHFPIVVTFAPLD
ncbi:MAG: endonuclease/exonuclease/phosphatase family protein [Deltaproteobacteria bacterium]|nr:endonuclease/exonuclease/phosphatase family protein [Deltaproteobacteria bacterium]